MQEQTNTHKQCSGLLEYNSRVTKLQNSEGSRNSPLLFLPSTHPHPVEKLKHLEHNRMAFLQREKKRQRARPASSWKPTTQKPPHMSDHEGGKKESPQASKPNTLTNWLTDWLHAGGLEGGAATAAAVGKEGWHSNLWELLLLLRRLDFFSLRKLQILSLLQPNQRAKFQ